MKDTQLVFILGSGRCGTKAITKMLLGVDGIEAHHEYCRYHYQREAILHAMGRLSSALLAPRLESIYTSAAHYSACPIFLDSSHKLVWVTELLAEMFPTAKFIHLMRDGRNVVSSFYYKLNLHNDRAAGLFSKWKNKPGILPVPPPSEQYWMSPYVRSTNRFERVCWHWVDTNQYILDGLDELDNSRWLYVKLENLVSNPQEVNALTDFIGIDYQKGFWDFLQRPDHVYVPIQYSLSNSQREVFEHIAGGMMNTLGYNLDEREADVKY